MTVHIAMYLRPEASASMSASAERIAETRIGAHQGAAVAGILGLESVDTRVAFAVKTVDGSVVTEVVGDNATESHLMQIASELLRRLPASRLRCSPSCSPRVQMWELAFKGMVRHQYAHAPQVPISSVPTTYPIGVT